MAWHQVSAGSRWTAQRLSNSHSMVSLTYGTSRDGQCLCYPCLDVPDRLGPTRVTAGVAPSCPEATRLRSSMHLSNKSTARYITPWHRGLTICFVKIEKPGPNILCRFESYGTPSARKVFGLHKMQPLSQHESSSFQDRFHSGQA